MKKPEFLKKVKHIHFVGIKGVGMTALALCAQDLGIKVTGSDVKEFFVTDKILKQRKISWQVGFGEKNLSPRPDLLITTGAHGGLGNPEVVAAGQMKIPILPRAEALGKIMEGKDGISVCGVGGKTTTCSMMVTVLDFARQSPSFAIGVGEIFPLGAPGRYDSGEEFVAEADEFATSPGIDNRPQFEFQNPKITVCTNIEYDHPDIYRNLGHTKRTFKKFFEKTPKDGLLVVCADNPNNLDVVKDFSGNLETYGFSARADWRVENVYFSQRETFYNLAHKGIVTDGIRLKVPGKFNVLNATATFAVGTFLGLSLKTIKQGIGEFAGAKRRFEFVDEENGIKLYDDYAHHPQEIKATLSAAKLWFPQQKIMAIFQPHTFSRTKALFEEFSQAFSQANMVVITDIYASAREKDDLGVNAKMLAEEVSKHHSSAFYEPGEEEVCEFLRKKAKPGDIILTIGAGNIFLWHQNILKSLKS